LVDRGPDVSEENPLVGYRERFVRDWPGPARRPEGDGSFPQGWRRAAMDLARDESVFRELVESLDEEDRRLYESDSARRRSLAAELMKREAPSSTGPVRPTALSVGALIDYARCPKRFYWSVVRPLPRFSGPAARIGTQIHAWIERRSSGQTSLLDLDEAPDLTVEELAREPGKIDRLQRNFQESRFATQVPLYAERPFILYLEGFVVGGRIDAIFGTADGPWEVVDYKTGRMPSEDDQLSGLQLDLYALACTEVFGKRPEDLTLTYFYLATGESSSRPAGDARVTRARTVEWLRAISRGEFAPTPDEPCHWCDFLPFCEAGRAYVDRAADGASGAGERESSG
jgi:RecB family exonuclease